MRQGNVIYVDFRARRRLVDADLVMPVVVGLFAGAALAHLMADLFGSR